MAAGKYSPMAMAARMARAASELELIRRSMISLTDAQKSGMPSRTAPIAVGSCVTSSLATPACPAIQPVRASRPPTR